MYTNLYPPPVYMFISHIYIICTRILCSLNDDTVSIMCVGWRSRGLVSHMVGCGVGTSGPRAPVLCSVDKAHSYYPPRQQSARTYLYYNIMYVPTYQYIIIIKYILLYYNPLRSIVLLYNVRM